MPFPCPPEEVATRAEQLREAVLADLAADGIGDASAQTSVEIDLRFMRQPSELVVSADHGFDEAAQEAMVAAFKADYLGRYGSGSIAAGASVEIAALRVIGTGSTLRAVLNKAAPAASELRSIGRREVKVERHGQMVDEMANVYDGADLAPGHVLVGPALIDTVDTTIWLPAGARAKVDPWRTLDIEVGL
jgi:N-methylhydantoinase A